jgi:hypothetical protein
VVRETLELVEYAQEQSREPITEAVADVPRWQGAEGFATSKEVTLQFLHSGFLVQRLAAVLVCPSEAF